MSRPVHREREREIGIFENIEQEERGRQELDHMK